MGDKSIQNIRQIVDEHQSSVTLSKCCIKTQHFLLKKLKEQWKRQTVEINSINKMNMRLEMEIKLDEQKRKSLHIALDTIKSANVEAEKEYLLIKEFRSDNAEHMKNRIIKYEKEWAVAQEKYGNISYIKKYLDVKNKIQASQDNLKALLNQSNELSTQINKKRYEMAALEKERVIKLAQFIVIDRPMFLKTLNENVARKRKLSVTNQQIMKEKRFVPTSASPKMNVDVKIPASTESPQSNVGLLLPPIQMQSVDLDVLSVRLNEIKKMEISKHNEIANIPVTETIQKVNTPHLKDDYISSYFDVCSVTKADTNDYSNKKLIHILEDIKLNENETNDIIAKVTPSKLHDVNVIESKYTKAADSKEKDFNEKQNSDRLSQKTPIETGEIEEINLTASNSQALVVLPPTQFMDLTQETQYTHTPESGILKDGFSRKSQEKKVCFELKGNEPENMDVDSSLLNTSVKNMVLKKNNLDLSPEFIYSKNTLQTKPKDNIVTSKFFKKEDQNVAEPKEYENNNVNSNIIDKDKQNNPETTEYQSVGSTSQAGEAVRPMGGLLFAHSPHRLLESLDLSCTDNAEGDSEYLHGIDSSLLMSPKADDIQNNEDQNNKSEGIFNFLAGIKRPDFKFSGSGAPKQETGTGSQENNNFNFSFGGETKKKGGLFSMFR
ncbi:uncharacterized protein LOC110994528 isoform X2 [Pieris rapae]|uniref:uncharacterized protein LOC110994528 isoform X2 n=1 Tax=Pieris rapae TaxID=64459 RepID=UPI001E27CA29|nr:uncharacterized protein LOC110994528 isoform X2 [Pieris rapae]